MQTLMKKILFTEVFKKTLYFCPKASPSGTHLEAEKKKISVKLTEPITYVNLSVSGLQPVELGLPFL